MAVTTPSLCGFLREEPFLVLIGRPWMPLGWGDSLGALRTQVNKMSLLAKVLMFAIVNTILYQLCLHVFSIPMHLLGAQHNNGMVTVCVAGKVSSLSNTGLVKQGLCLQCPWAMSGTNTHMDRDPLQALYCTLTIWASVSSSVI